MVLMWLGAWGGALGSRWKRGAPVPLVRMPRPVRRGPCASAPRSRRFWIRVDPRDHRHAAIGGSFAQVCAALEKLAAEENAK
ncbi:MAG: hypothetical protein ABW220_09800 [Burkholderiaceae bacterium]